MSEKRFKLTTEEDICYCEYTYWKGDEPLGMEEVVDVLNEQDDELHKYRTENAELHITILENGKEIDEQQATIEQLKEENSNLNSILNEVGLQKPFIKILDDYMIEYDGSCFSMHKPSDIRSFVYLMNRNNNFDELQCGYNDERMVFDDE